MSKRAKRLRRRIREGDPGVKNLFDIRISTAPMRSDEELAATNDKFPGDEFDWARWSAKSVSGATEIRSLLDSFRLVGRKIWNVWTTSHDYFNDKDGLEDAVCSDLADRLGLSDAAARAGSSIHALARRAIIARRMEIDQPFVIEFDSRETFEMDVEIAPVYRISMNKIPLRLLKDRHDNVDPAILFSPVLGRTITAVDLKTVPEGGQDDSVESVLLCLDNGNTIELRGFYDYLDVGLLDRRSEPRLASIECLRHGFFNYEDLHFDRGTGFEAKDATLWFGWKGEHMLGNHAIVLTPTGLPGRPRPVEPARIDRRDALGLVLGLCAKCPERLASWGAIELPAAEWFAVLETGREFLSGPRLSNDAAPLARLFFETPPRAHERFCDGTTDADRMRMKRDRARTCLSELRRWSAKSVAPDGGIRIEL